MVKVKFQKRGVASGATQVACFFLPTFFLIFGVPNGPANAL